MGEFMVNHTDLAKGILPNTAQGKAKANQLWEQLTSKLNASGPPIKDAKMWRKVYADQKQLIKRKCAFNKLSKKRTGGGPYEEKVLCQVDEQILAAAGVEVAVEGLKNVKTFGSAMQIKQGEEMSEAKDCSDNITTSRSNPSCNDSFTSACILFDNEEVHTENISSCTEIEDNEEENEKTVVIKNVKPKEMTKINKRETKTTSLKKI